MLHTIETNKRKELDPTDTNAVEYINRHYPELTHEAIVDIIKQKGPFYDDINLYLESLNTNSNIDKRIDQMTPLIDVLEKLRLKNIDKEFRWTDKGFSASTGKYYQPDHLEIIKVYRFEGQSDPGDMCIVYLIEANDGLIGYSLDAYGTYSCHDEENGYDNFIRQIPERGHLQQMAFEL